MLNTSRIIAKAGPWGLYTLARALCRRQPRILMYHRFSKEERAGFTSEQSFRRQLEYIVRHFRPMTLRDLASSIYEHGKVPSNAVVVTIDDGYRDFYDVAYPLLKEFEVPATLFATTGFINGDYWLWPDQVKYLLDETTKITEPVTLESVRLNPGALGEDARGRYWNQLNSLLLSVSDETKYRLIDELSQELGTVLPDSAPESYAALDWCQLQEMEAWGVEVGGHTVTHPSLGQVTLDQAQTEISVCLEVLQENLGSLPRTFCFPNGQPRDCPEPVKKLVSESGFLAAVVAFSDVQGVNDRYAIRRHSSGDNYFQFLKAVSGVEYLGHRVRGQRYHLARGVHQPV